MKIGELLKLNDAYDRMSIRVRNTVTEGLYVPEWIQLPLIFVTPDNILSCTVKVGDPSTCHLWTRKRNRLSCTVKVGDPSTNEIKEVAPFLEIIEGKEYDYGYGSYENFSSLKHLYGELDLSEYLL